MKERKLQGVTVSVNGSSCSSGREEVLSYFGEATRFWLDLLNFCRIPNCLNIALQEQSLTKTVFFLDGF